MWQELVELPEANLNVVRKKLIWAYSWAVPSDEAIRALAHHGPLIELGAGTGYWAWLCAQGGGDVLAFDHAPEPPPHWYPVKSGGAETLASHPGRNLLLCWPSYDDDFALSCLELVQANRVIYVGEWRGRTANKAFHDLLEQRFRRIQEVKLPVWPGFHDSLFVYERML